jgi:uncharacterized protein YgiM (DUF1202 family)
MKTFILLTFGFLGFAFDEMSGGSDFEPASARQAQATPEATATDVATKAAAPQEASQTASIAKISNTPSVTRVALNLTNVSGAAEAATAEVATPAPQPATTAQILDSTETPQIILPSLIATTDDASGNDAIFASDIRSVSGNRVNVRGGPSTNYGVVGKLTRGAEVRILEDNGDGWVRMQPVDGGEAGWMADFLLTSG